MVLSSCDSNFNEVQQSPGGQQDDEIVVNTFDIWRLTILVIEIVGVTYEVRARTRNFTHESKKKLALHDILAENEQIRRATLAGNSEVVQETSSVESWNDLGGASQGGVKAKDVFLFSLNHQQQEVILLLHYMYLFSFFKCCECPCSSELMINMHLNDSSPLHLFQLSSFKPILYVFTNYFLATSSKDRQIYLLRSGKIR